MEFEYKIIIEDGKQFLSLKGDKLPNQISTKVEQDAEHAQIGVGLVTVTVLAKMIDTTHEL